MRLDLLAPWNLACAAGLLPVAAACVVVRRRQVRAVDTLGLSAAGLLRSLGAPLLLVIAAALVAVAAARPALVTTRAQAVRTDVEAYLVIDTSVSMLARARRHGPPRIDEARGFALGLAAALPPTLRVGVAVMPQGLLPALAPTTDRELLRRVLHDAVAVGAITAKPQDQLLPPSGAAPTPSRAGAPYVATNLTALKTLVTAPFFRHRSSRRLAILVTDAESTSFKVGSVAGELARARVHLLVVRVGSARDHMWRAVHGRVVLDPGYAPAIASYGQVSALAKSFGSGVYRADQLGAVDVKARRLLGSGPEAVSRKVLRHRPLGPYLALAAIVLAAFPFGPVLPAPPALSGGRARRLAPGRRRSRPATPLSPP